MIERKIGERFFEGTTQLRVVPSDGFAMCHDCYYESVRLECKCNHLNAGYCIPAFRKDKTDVYFKEV